MRNKREEQREGLKARLIDAAEARIAAGGLAGLKAREVTADAGCALGALYNAFDDLDRLVLHVNSRTLARLGVALAAACPAGVGPKDTLAALATRVAVLSEGRILAFGPLDEIMNVQDPFIERFFHSERSQAALARGRAER